MPTKHNLRSSTRLQAPIRRSARIREAREPTLDIKRDGKKWEDGKDYVVVRGEVKDESHFSQDIGSIW